MSAHRGRDEPTFAPVLHDLRVVLARLAGVSCTAIGVLRRGKRVCRRRQKGLKKQCIIVSCYQIKAVTLLLLMALWRRQEAAQGLSMGANGRL